MTDKPILRLIAVLEGGLPEAPVGEGQRAFALAAGFSGQRGRLLALMREGGGLEGYLFGLGNDDPAGDFLLGLAAGLVEPGTYRLEGAIGDPTRAALGFRLGAYRFERYRKGRGPVLLEPLEGADAALVGRLAEAAFIARDLINTPASDLGPDQFAREIAIFAGRRRMGFSEIVGDALLDNNFPMIHAVGRASAEAPRLVELTWGREDHPRVTLVGKGVTFDTGGLDIKPSSSMLLMKKDMGGAANVLGLAHAVVDAQLPVRLRVLVPIVENAISGSSFRPGDVLTARTGQTVEIGNTDAEGRLILADALALADEESPELIVDMATLTGAARVALGPDLPPVYASADDLAQRLVELGGAWNDPLWHMPLWAPYDGLLRSPIADLSHISSGPFAGSITAALFLKRFVKSAAQWAHFDIYGWAPEVRPGRPQGGTDQAIRAVYALLAERYRPAR